MDIRSPPGMVIPKEGSLCYERKGAAVKTILVILISSACIIIQGCMTQQSATKQTSHEFTRELPNHPKSEVFERAVKWMAMNCRSEKPGAEYQDRRAGSIVSYVNTVIKPEGSWVNMPVGFTITDRVSGE